MEDLTLVGATRSVEEAKKYAKIFISQIVDRHKDITGYNIDVSVNKTNLWWIPFSDDVDSNQVTNLASGHRYPIAVVENITKIKSQSSHK